MPSFTTKYAALAASLTAAVHALDGITVPTSIAAGDSVPVSFDNGNSDSYRVYLAAALVGVNGPTCYLENSTSLSSPFDVSIPPSVGPSADYYSIAIADLTTNQGATYSNRFNLTGGTGQYSNYESQLGGAPFWDANDLPCTAYACARACASASYPSDLTDTSAYDTMKSCILKCSGVTSAPRQTAPPLASSTAKEALATTISAEEALITVASGVVLTAIETTVVSGGKTVTEAIVDGSRTIVLGGAATVLSSMTVSLASDGVAVDGTTTLPFTSAAVTMTDSATTTATGAAAASSTGAAVRQNVAIVGVAGMAGLAALVL